MDPTGFPDSFWWRWGVIGRTFNSCNSAQDQALADRIIHNVQIGGPSRPGSEGGDKWLGVWRARPHCHAQINLLGEALSLQQDQQREITYQTFQVAALYPIFHFCLKSERQRKRVSERKRENERKRKGGASGGPGLVCDCCFILWTAWCNRTMEICSEWRVLSRSWPHCKPRE